MGNARAYDDFGKEHVWDLLEHAAASDQYSGIYIVRPDEEGLQDLTNMAEGDESRSEWSPGGEAIAFTRSKHMGGYSSGLYLLDPVSQSKTQLATSPDVIGLRWSPDGSSIVLQHIVDPGPAETAMLAIVDVETGEITDLGTVDGLAELDCGWSLRHRRRGWTLHSPARSIRLPASTVGRLSSKGQAGRALADWEQDDRG